jgi:hypothetical protein
VNNGAINSFSINGAAVPNWIVRAVGIAAVAAATVTATPTRVASAAAYGDAVATVTLAPTQTVLARATATAGVSSYLAPHIIYAGKSSANAVATGNGSVRRDIFAQAAGDAHATGEALTAQALGNANATMGCTVVLCKPHIVFFGKSNIIGLASTVSGSAKVTRYCTANTAAGIGYTRGEASIKLSGTSYYLRDGFVPNATAGCTASIPQDRIKIIATLGSFTFSECIAQANTFVRYAAKSNESGVATSQAVNSYKILKGAVNASAQANATITGTRVALGIVSAQTGASHLSINARFVRAAAGTSEAIATSIVANGKRSANGEVIGLAGADSNYPLMGKQNKATASDTAIATAELVASRIKYAAASIGDTAQATTVQASGTLIVLARANAIALASVGKAYAVANSDISAPADRYMVVGAELREMTVPFEDRTMTVTA